MSLQGWIRHEELLKRKAAKQFRLVNTLYFLALLGSTLAVVLDVFTPAGSGVVIALQLAGYAVLAENERQAVVERRLVALERTITKAGIEPVFEEDDLF